MGTAEIQPWLKSFASMQREKKKKKIKRKPPQQLPVRESSPSCSLSSTGFISVALEWDKEEQIQSSRVESGKKEAQNFHLNVAHEERKVQRKRARKPLETALPQENSRTISHTQEGLGMPLTENVKGFFTRNVKSKGIAKGLHPPSHPIPLCFPLQFVTKAPFIHENTNPRTPLSLLELLPQPGSPKAPTLCSHFWFCGTSTRE